MLAGYPKKAFEAIAGYLEDGRKPPAKDYFRPFDLTGKKTTDCPGKYLHDHKKFWACHVDGPATCKRLPK